MTCLRDTRPSIPGTFAALTLVIMALFGCDDGANEPKPVPDGKAGTAGDGGPKTIDVVGEPDAGESCVRTSITSLVRTQADWGWTEGAATYAAYRVEDEAVGLKGDCQKRLPSRDESVTFSAVEVVQDGSEQPLVPTDPACDVEIGWDGPPVIVTGCGFVSRITTWEVEVYDEATGCLVGAARQIDGGILVEGCLHSPVFAGRFPTDCPDEHMEVACGIADDDAGITDDAGL